MSVLIFSHLPRPENLHEIARFRLIEVVEVLPKPELVKKTGCARSVCVPSAPDTFAVALISNDESLQRGIIEVPLPVRAQSLDRPDKNQICCDCEKTR